ncbi:PEGA domain-containing protein [Geotalea toluenoxydans]|uniref:PEGA domain-containing protein n=1 Tax=Geotalea toluenoxydans TaxID=421624 RepID=UPI0006D064CA|nr:PEGA domain-containing protein [Geotalea toluenoxydans]
MKKICILVVMVTMACLLGGCGSTSKVVKDMVITSEPSGATVFLDGDKVGETPLKVQTFFTWNKEELYNSLLRRVIQVKKEGFESQIRDMYPIDMPNLHFLLNRENVTGEKK